MERLKEKRERKVFALPPSRIRMVSRVAVARSSSSAEHTKKTFLAMSPPAAASGKKRGRRRRRRPSASSFLSMPCLAFRHFKDVWFLSHEYICSHLLLLMTCHVCTSVGGSL